MAHTPGVFWAPSSLSLAVPPLLHPMSPGPCKAAPSMVSAFPNHLKQWRMCWGSVSWWSEGSHGSQEGGHCW